MTLEIRQVDRSDEDALHDWWTCGHSAMSHRPVDLWPDWEISRYALPQVDQDNRVDLLGAHDGDTMVGAAVVVLPSKENLHLAMLAVYTPPEHRRRGVGGALLARCEEIAAEEARTTLLADVKAPLEEDGDDLRWAQKHGYAVANVDGVKVCELAATAHLLPALEAEAAEKLGDYRLKWWLEPAPEEHLESLAAAMSRFLAEIPLGDVDLEPEDYTAERIRAREQRHAAGRRQQLTVVALAPSGDVVGFTELGLSVHAPRLADIGSTLVLPGHRGHRLGLAIKVLLHQKARELFPDIEVIATGNATSNTFMNAVNEKLGYRLVDRNLETQKVTA